MMGFFLPGIYTIRVPGFEEMCMSFTSELYQTIELSEVDSTNRYLKTELSEGRLTGPIFCRAHSQTAGYGQRGRAWTQSLDSLTFSIALPFDGRIGEMPFISAQIALLLRQSIAEASHATNLTVKWPNDVFLDGKKVAGCLIEMLSPSPSRKEGYLIIGVGVNCSPVSGDGFDAQYVNDLDSERFFQSFSVALYELFMVDMRPVFKLSEWRNHDFFTPGQEVIVYHNDSSETGRYAGLDEMACAMVEIEGRVKRYQSGAVSIRPL
jgi:BirA family biotin operon repressor/biotin-[acetyl-CoA-carboxylase] ligase